MAANQNCIICQKHIWLFKKKTSLGFVCRSCFTSLSHKGVSLFDYSLYSIDELQAKLKIENISNQDLKEKAQTLLNKTNGNKLEAMKLFQKETGVSLSLVKGIFLELTVSKDDNNSLFEEAKSCLIENYGNKIVAIKELRQQHSLSLSEAKDIIEQCLEDKNFQKELEKLQD